MKHCHIWMIPLCRHLLLASYSP